MMNDTVREELHSNLKTGSGQLDRGILSAGSAPIGERKSEIRVDMKALTPPPTLQPPPAPIKLDSTPVAPQKLPPANLDTAGLKTKKTSQTLVGFQTKRPAVPEWRLELQNKIRQRKSDVVPASPVEKAVATRGPATRGATALKIEYVEEAKTVDVNNPTVASALRRIEESRRAFTPPAQLAKELAESGIVKTAERPANRNYPFNVVARNENSAAAIAQPSAARKAGSKPRLVSSLRIEKKAYDTNKLPPINEPAKFSSSLDEAGNEAPKRSVPAPSDAETVVSNQIGAEPVTAEVEADILDEMDDLAPVAIRFNAGLFDLVIGVVVAALLLAPFLMAGGTWYSVSGVLAIVAALAITMFVYLTASLAYFGQTVGMRIFSLELIDIYQNEYPTVHQAAVNSCVYILSLGFAGLGFVPMFLNDERRAAHDLISGTILVREI
ncbi:MAG: RDD family protein [Acidobacteria bacterium]|nr:RDD family protein [Acidobacteriota bacterium]